MASGTNPIDWYGTAWRDFSQFPDVVHRRMEHALQVAQLGGKHSSAKVLAGLGNARTLEVRVVHQGSTFRLVYTILSPRHIIVVHCYQKKSTRGISTPKPDATIIVQRLKNIMRERFL